LRFSKNSTIKVTDHYNTRTLEDFFEFFTIQ